jgi:hypothetical protein
LVDAYRLQQLMKSGEPAHCELLVKLLNASLSGLACFDTSGDLDEPADRRLAFRELGLAIGLHAATALRKSIAGHASHSPAWAPAIQQLEALPEYAPLADRIESFWRDPEHRSSRLWLEHRDINDVMLATSLMPTGFIDAC